MAAGARGTIPPCWGCCCWTRRRGRRWRSRTRRRWRRSLCVACVCVGGCVGHTQAKAKKKARVRLSYAHHGRCEFQRLAPPRLTRAKHSFRPHRQQPSQVCRSYQSSINTHYSIPRQAHRSIDRATAAGGCFLGGGSRSRKIESVQARWHSSRAKRGQERKQSSPPWHGSGTRQVGWMCFLKEPRMNSIE